MKTMSGLAVALFAISGAATKVVYAQATLPAYSILEVEVIDPVAFQAFAQRNATALHVAGARFIVRRGRVVTSAGEPAKAIFVIAWDSLDKAAGYFDSPAFKELIPLRDQAATMRLFHVEGLPPNSHARPTN